MNRLEKKNVRLNMIQILDKRCKGCMMRSDPSAHQYCIKHCEVSQGLQQLATSLAKEGAKRPEKMEIKTGRWNDDEELYLLNHMEHFSVDHLAIRLNRSPNSVYSKIKRLMEQKKANTNLERCVDHHGL